MPSNTLPAQPPSATSEGQAVVPQGMKKGDILEQIKAQRIKDVAAAKAAVPLEVLLKQIVDTPLKPIDFAARLRAALPTCVLAEVKRASPSKGIIAAGIDAAAQAVKYAEGGAAAISVLTEPTWFKGTLDDMLGAAKSVSAMVNRPAILRKDFIIDAYQVYEARANGADAVLLIVAILTDEQLSELLEVTRSLGMEALVEVVSPEEIARALAAGSTVIGVNNRNLRTFNVDTTKTQRVLQSAGVVGPNAVGDGSGKVLLALSGIQSRVDVQGYRASGVHGVLVGEALMRCPDPSAMIRQLRGLDDEVLVKICGIKDNAAAEAAVRAGADFLGFVFAPKSPREVSVEQARGIIDHVLGMFPAEQPAKLERAIVGLDTPALEWYPESAEHIRTACARRPQFVGVFANQAAADVNRIALDAKLDIIQLSGHEGMNTAGEHVLPVIKAVHIAHEATLGEVTAAFQQGRPHALLLDTKSPSQPGMMGGTGEVFDWALGAEAQQVAPLFLAGGLSPDNVFDAVQQVRPYGVDVSSGVEKSKGVKDLDKITMFVREAKRQPAVAQPTSAAADAPACATTSTKAAWV